MRGIIRPLPGPQALRHHGEVPVLIYRPGRLRRPAPLAGILDVVGELVAARAEWPDMALATSGAKGAEKLAIKWARQKGVTLVLAKADFDRHGRAAPFRANDEMLSLDPVCVLTLVNSLNADRAKSLNVFGPAANLAQKAAERGLRHHPIKARI